MSRKSHLNFADVTDHPVLSESGTYSVVEVRATFDTIQQQDNLLYLTFQRDGERIELKFVGVQELEIEAGFPYLSSPVRILDVARWQYDGIQIRVTSDEQDPGIQFWARAVERVSA